ncbi:MAG TPA: acyltransferase [Coleofasciculaceae cyanobacterium]|jgi:peptidoglycan/LPS O-acetylase OafA/YrhL
MANSSTNKDWFSFLDGLRGLAAAWVMLAHCVGFAAWDGPIKSAALAVDIFMIISGFLMAFHYRYREKSQPWESSQTWYKFYLRRFFRIAPLYYLLLIPSFIFKDYFDFCKEVVRQIPNIDPNLLNKLSTTIFNIQPLDFLELFTHITFTSGIFPRYENSLIIPDWSLSLEMQFYIAFPFIMLWLRKFSYFWIAVSLAVVSFFVNEVILSYYGQPSFLLLKINFFIIGILLAEAFFFRLRNPLTSAYLVSLALVLTTYSRKAGFIIFIVVLICALIFYDKNNDSLRLSKLITLVHENLGSRLAKFSSDTSYAVYLFHMLLLAPLGAVLTKHEFYLSLPAIARATILFAVVAPLTYFVAFLLFKYVEKPGIALGRTLIAKIYRKPTLN